ncbi:MAG TPA: DNA recombination protein RmuC [Vicinamibacterales bacterium]|nr:DNA recombination protein RmuC [Vicinamibacterales bacterium]
METVVFIVAFVSVSVAAVLAALNRKAVQSLGNDIESLPRKVDGTLRDELRHHRAETSDSVHRFGDSLVQAQTALGQAQARQIETLRAGLERQVEALRTTVDDRLRAMQDDNATKLDQMRQTVDEKLQSTLEARLGESFRQVSDRLEQVYKGLGEMQVLATGVGDLRRVLSNVKTRGTWGEVQLATLLEQVLAPDQYACNVATSETGGERVEFAIRLPGRSIGNEGSMWLPIDSKFPLEDYQALLEASDRADAAAVECAGRRLEARVRSSAKEISSKYLNPPTTTDFAIMFLPNEGLYAEVLRRPGLADALQRDHRIVIAGPTTLWGILTSFQMGFRTLAIERRSSEVWALLGAVKTEFAKFGTVLDGIQKNLHRAASKIDEARKGTRTIQRKLSDVQELPSADATTLLEGLVVSVVDEHEQVA